VFSVLISLLLSAPASDGTPLDIRSFGVVKQSSGKDDYYAFEYGPEGPYLAARYRPPFDTMVRGIEAPQRYRRSLAGIRWRWRVRAFPKGGDDCNPDVGDAAHMALPTNSCAAIQDGIETWLEQHDVVYAQRTIPFVLMPHFVSPGQVRRIRRAVEALTRVLDRFCEAYVEDDRLRVELDIGDQEDELIRLEPGFGNPMRICRLDAFLQGYDIKFLEFNADSPAGIGYTDVLYDGLCEGIHLPRVDAEFDTAYTPMLPELVTTLQDAYRELRLHSPHLPVLPRVALVDVEGSPSVPEFRIICAATLNTRAA